jgi:Fe-S-cluster containining protein
LPRILVKVAFNNIKFECQRCGSCCHHKRPPDFEDLVPLERLNEFWKKSNLIYLTEKDITNISSRAGLSAEEFVDTLYEYDGQSVKVENEGRKIILDLPVMKSKEDTTCVFYRERDGCKIYGMRPIACRLFPFLVEEESTSEGDIILNINYNSSCPGIGKGYRVDADKLQSLVIEQFMLRSQEIAPQVQKFKSEGKISADAQIFRTLPGRQRR